MKKNTFLLLGYSHIAKKRIIDVFIKNKIEFSIASKSHKEKIKKVKKQFSDYNDALVNSKANIVYISLPNALHFYWAKKALLLGYHVIIDKPICNKLSETKKLIKIAKTNRKLLSEAIFYNYHNQIKRVINIAGGKKAIKEIKVNFIIPMPNKNSLLMSKKFDGGAIMDMGPYASSIDRIFFDEKIKYLKIESYKNRKNLPIGFEFCVNYQKRQYTGLFKFGGDYINQVKFFTKTKEITLQRVFSPPSDLDLNVNVIEDKSIKNYQVKKDNCFENYLLELLKKINQKNYSYYCKQIEQDHLFRDKIQKKFLRS